MRLLLLPLLLPLVLMSLSSCSTVQTDVGGTSLADIQAKERFQLKVRTGHPIMDSMVYEMAYLQFDDVLPLREKGPYTGVVEISFLSSSQGGYMGSSNTFGTIAGSTSGWYTGSGFGGMGSATLSTSTFSSGMMLQWQNSSMTIVIKKADGQRLWTADYNYKGGWEMSGWVVNTPDEAARLLIKRLKQRLIADYEKKNAKT